jgi:hypothetical protein
LQSIRCKAETKGKVKHAFPLSDINLAGINQQVAVSDRLVNKSGWQYKAKRAKISDENGPCRSPVMKCWQTAAGRMPGMQPIHPTRPLSRA